MATHIVTQRTPDCKPSGKESSWFKSPFQCDHDLTIGKVSHMLRDLLVKEIMSGTNETAFNILNSIDVIGHIPGDGKNFIPVNAFAKFYGISEKFLTDMLCRRRLLQKNYPDDVVSTSLNEVIHNPGIPVQCCDHQCMPGRSDLTQCMFTDGSNLPCVCLPSKKVFRAYSPRLVLTVSLYLLDSDKSGVCNAIQKAAMAIKRSDYRLLRNTRPAVSEERHISAEAAPAVQPAPENVKDSLDSVIQLLWSMREMLCGTPVAAQQAENTASAKSNEPANPVSSAVQRPDGWDDLVANWKFGKISTYKAAKQANMSSADFYNFARGKRTFA